MAQTEKITPVLLFEAKQREKNADMLLFLKKKREKSTDLILFGGKKRKKMRTGDFLRKMKWIKKRKSMHMLIFLVAQRK
jgi:16S rRNA G1207 methylase RsmC